MQQYRQAIPACSHQIIGQESWTCCPSMQLRPITGQEIQTHYPSMHSADKLSQHALQNMHCIKEAAKAQNSGQAVDKLTQ